MRRTKRFAGFALAACMGVSLLVNVPVGTVSAAEPTEMVTSPVASVAEEEVPAATGTDAEALDEAQEVVYDESEADADGFVWYGTTIVRYVGKGGDVKIPEKCTSIGEMAFMGCSGLTSIKMPSSVTSIGATAFEASIFFITGSINKNFFASIPHISSLFLNVPNLRFTFL